MSTVQRWLSALGDTAIAEYPPLAVLAGWITVLTGQAAEAQRWAAIVDAASFDLVPADGSASFGSARAMLRAVMCAAGAKQMVADVNFAAAREAPWSAWRDGSDLLARRSAPAQRRRRPGRALFAESSAAAAAAGNPDVIVVSESELAVLAMDGGRWPEAAGRVEAALAVVDEARMQDYATSVLAFAAAARLAVHRGDMEGANRELTRAMRAPPDLTFGFPFLAVRLRLQLAKVYWAIADYSAARHPAAGR
jgi:LuxR family maltose regulon positive regulatory protein